MSENYPNEPQDIAAAQIAALGQTRFVFHAFQDLPIIGPNGVMFNLDSLRLDRREGREKVGVTHLKRLQLLPITATQKPVINNKDGFSVSNVFVGALDGNQSPIGFGSGMQNGKRTNVEGKWDYPAAKIADMLYVYGRYGLIAANSVYANSPEEEKTVYQLESVLLSGIPAHATLEDLPEYFVTADDEIYYNEFIPDKKQFAFKRKAHQVLADAFDAKRISFDLFNKGMILIREMQSSIIQAHVAALDPAQSGVLPNSKTAVAKKEKAQYDKCDSWFMNQFPSYPMDTEIEKMNKQFVRALDSAGGAEQSSAADQSAIDFYELYKAEQARNDKKDELILQMAERLSRIEGRMEATPAAAPHPPETPSQPEPPQQSQSEAQPPVEPQPPAQTPAPAPEPPKAPVTPNKPNRSR